MLSGARRYLQVRGQRGSVLSALLIVVAFLSILGGALLNEISGQFLLTKTLANRIATEATVNSSVEYAIGQLQARAVPSRCSTDAGPDSSISLNGSAALARQTCLAIVPDNVAQVAAGSFGEDGTHVTTGGRDTYLVGDGGGHVYNYRFGQTNFMWRVSLGRGVTGSPAQEPDASRSGHFITVIPTGAGASLVDDFGFGASPRCTMGAAGTVTSQAGFENPPAGSPAYFPTYTYFGDSSGRLYVFDARTGGSCVRMATVSGLGGAVVGGPLVLTGQQLNGSSQCNNGGDNDNDEGDVSRTVEIFAIVNAGGNGRMVHYEYCETTQGGQTVDSTLSSVESRSLSVHGPVGVAYSSTVPVGGQNLRLAVTFQGGQVAIASIQVNRGGGGMSYTTSTGPVASLGGSFSGAPYWCHCPGGDRIGAGSTSGILFILDTNLGVRLRFDGATAINTTPAADATGDWYFGADDGYVHLVEPPAAGTAMFAAARFGPGVPMRSSPVVGSAGDGCAGRACLYFGGGSESDFAQIGDIRIMDLRACPTSGGGAGSCSGEPRLWARVEVGNPTYVGGLGVHVIAWSYFTS